MSSDEELQKEIAALKSIQEESKGQVQKNKSYTNDRKAMEAKLESFRKSTVWAWKETLSMSTELTGDDMVESVHDDLQREMAFHTATVAAVADAHKRLRERKIPFQRPRDFYAEMLKSDDHMMKIKAELVAEKERMNAVDRRRKSQLNKKIQKELQEEKRKERNEKKKRMLSAVKQWRDKKKDGDEFGIDLMEAAVEEDQGPKRKGKKRRAADQRWGTGPKRNKRNDSRSTNDFDFNPKGQKFNGNSRSNRGGGGGGGRSNNSRSTNKNRPSKKRPGKSRRQQNRGSNKRG